MVKGIDADDYFIDEQYIDEVKFNVMAIDGGSITVNIVKEWL